MPRSDRRSSRDAGWDAGTDAGWDSGGCPSGFADCNGLAGDGCETSIRTLSDCGGCGVTCSRANATATCATGTCLIASCDTDYGNCNGLHSDGCERYLAADVDACGSCSTVCPTRSNASRTCASSTCGFTCDAGYEDCNSSATDGCEVMTSSDVDNCSGCGVTCPTRANATRTCASGTCGFTCDAGYADCNSTASDGCEVVTSSDVDNCSGCGVTCPTRANATRTCSGGTCGFTCDAGYADCNASATDGCEVHLASDPDHCGGCATVCPTRPNATRTCTSSTCGYTCNAGYRDCNGLASDGCEVNILTDPSNCNGCGISCPGMQMCCTGDCRSTC